MYEFNNEIIDSFSDINRAIYRLLKLDADRLGVTVVQLKALYRISTNPNMNLGELADKLRLTNSTVSGVIDRLVHSGLVERVVPQENRRSVSIHITEKGKEILDFAFHSESILLKKMNQLMEIPEEEIKHLLKLHKLVLSTLSHRED